ncbi:hypothetical protein ABS648_19080 [Pseudomonas solani]|uniref:Uncharacterized protein n=1 Tax=Pseudomonas solani TaxID=2731552 RepID=A0AAU7XWD3_9PSED
MNGHNRYEIIYKEYGSPRALMVEVDYQPSSADIYGLLMEKHGIPFTGEPRDNGDYLRMTAEKGITDVAVRRKY